MDTNPSTNWIQQSYFVDVTKAITIMHCISKGLFHQTFTGS